MRRRVLASAALTVLVVGVGLAVLVAGPLTWLTLGGSARLFEAVPREALDRCDADPAAFHHRSAEGVEAWALDRTTLRSPNPAAPALPAWLGLRLRLGERNPVMLARMSGGAILVLQRDGPCSALLLTVPVPLEVFAGVRNRVLLTLVGALAVAGGIAWFLVLGPLVRSLRDLDRASRSVGTEGYAAPVVEEDLQAVADALDAAHANVLAERTRYADERARLERRLADAAHDLRTPIAALQLRLERVVAGDHEALSGALADVTYLGLLTENLALTGQLDVGLREERQDVELTELVRRVTDRFALLGRRLGVEVVPVLPDEPVRVRGAPVYAEQIVANLVHNAVRHHDGTGTVVVVVEPGLDGVVLEVADDGPGLPEGLPMEPVATGARRGRGLSIVRTLAEALGWEMTVEAGEPRGLVFRFVVR